MTARPNTEQFEKPQFRKALRLPDVDGEREYEYVCALKQDAPMFCIHILGINFQKYVIPADASFRTNQDKHYSSQVLCFWLTEKQREAIEKRAKEVIIQIPRKVNLNWKQSDSKETEYSNSYSVYASDWILLEKKEIYNPMNFISQEKPKVFKTEVENIKSEIYESQSKKIKKGR